MADVVSGLVGLTVVLALRNATTPAKLKMTPMPAKAPATAAPRQGKCERRFVDRDEPHGDEKYQYERSRWNFEFKSDHKLETEA